MQISIASSKDIDSLYNIWKVCFSADMLFMKLFINECFPLTRTYIYKDGDTIVSSISIIPLNLIEDTKIKGAYLYGLCTLPQYRGKHLSINLLQHAEEDCRKRGYGFLIARPASPSLFAFYRKIGYSQPIYRQVVELPLPIFADGVSFSELTSTRLKDLRFRYLGSNYYEWDDSMLQYILSFLKLENGSAVELESDRYMIGYPDQEDNELYHIIELGCYNESLKYPTLYLAGNYIKAKHLERTKVKIYLPINKHYLDIEKTEKEVFVLIKPLSIEINDFSFFNFTME